MPLQQTPDIIYMLLDWFFTIFHSCLIIFNLIGWIWKYTRKINLATLLLTAGSWLILGLFYTIGYCPLTDWHFNILTRLGKTNLPLSYTQYIIQRISGIELTARQADLITASGLVLALIISVWLNTRDYLRKNSAKNLLTQPEK